MWASEEIVLELVKQFGIAAGKRYRGPGQKLNLFQKQIFLLRIHVGEHVHWWKSSDKSGHISIHVVFYPCF